METTIDQPDMMTQELETKRPSFFLRLRKSFTSFFRRRNNRKRNKSDSQVPEKQDSVPIPDSSLTNEPETEIIDEPVRTSTLIKPTEAKAPVFVNDFTSELKQSLKLRSRKIEEGEKSPTEVIKQIEGLRTLSCIVDDDKNDVKIENETKTFEEKLALFESQISGGSGSVQDTLKREKSDEVDNEKEENDEENQYREKEDGNSEHCDVDSEDMNAETKYSIDVVEYTDGNMDCDKDLDDGVISEEYEVNESGEGDFGLKECHHESMTNGHGSHNDSDDQFHKGVSGFVSKLIDDASEAINIDDTGVTRNTTSTDVQ